MGRHRGALIPQPALHDVVEDSRLGHPSPQLGTPAPVFQLGRLSVRRRAQRLPSPLSTAPRSFLRVPVCGSRKATMRYPQTTTALPRFRNTSASPGEVPPHLTRRWAGGSNSRHAGARARTFIRAALGGTGALSLWLTVPKREGWKRREVFSGNKTFDRV